MRGVVEGQDEVERYEALFKCCVKVTVEMDLSVRFAQKQNGDEIIIIAFGASPTRSTTLKSPPTARRVNITRRRTIHISP